MINLLFASTDKDICEACNDQLKRPPSIVKCKLCDNDSASRMKMVGIVIKYNDKPIFFQVGRYKKIAKDIQQESKALAKYYESFAIKSEG